MTSPPCQTVIFSPTQGEGSGAERVLENFLSSPHDRPVSCLLAPENSSVIRVARALGYRTIPWEARKNSLAENARAFQKFLHTHGRAPLGDVVHSWHTRGFEWAVALGKVWGRPCTGTLHDDPSHRQFGWVRQRIIQIASANLDGVVAVSQALATRCEQLHWKHPLCVIRNGLPDGPSLIKEASPLRVGFLASHSLWKGTALLADILARTEALPLEWHLYGEASEETSSILETLSQKPNVRLRGRRPSEEIFSQIDLLLHLSVEFDPFPTVLLEAARAGLPVIATLVGGTAEIVEQGRTGLLIPPRNPDEAVTALQRLCADPALRIRLGRAGRARFERHFPLERMVAEYRLFWNRVRLPHP